MNGCQAAGDWVGEKSAEGWVGGIVRAVGDQSVHLLIWKHELARWEYWKTIGSQVGATRVKLCFTTLRDEGRLEQ